MATRSRYRPPGPDIDGWPPGPFKLAKLADSRSAYSNLLSEVKSKVSILEASEKALAEVQAARDSSVSTSLLTRLDSPMVSDRPIGPGKTTISALCTIAGLVFGLGIVFVVTPIDASPVFGRRSLDRSLGRRDLDLTAAVAPTAGGSRKTEIPVETASTQKVEATAIKSKTMEVDIARRRHFSEQTKKDTLGRPLALQVVGIG